LPLPPYIKRAHGSDVEDAERYQTIYARERGAIAAPTAGLHFTPKVIDAIMQAGASVVEITLHVGYGTFEPVRVDVVEEHSVKSEQFVISNSAAKTINAARRQGGRVIAVGTTTTRALEAATDEGGTISAMTSEASLTITPGYRFKAVQALLTNFHLPKSSLLLLVAAFAGREFVLNAYAHAVAEQYRFYSYGDCMLII
jgi:S-adenosylmethionine:tRNA ribosyltransferase-isomerase